jgi:hypothetical protein
MSDVRCTTEGPDEMKHLSDLTRHDFSEFPTWVHLGGPDAESRVRPQPTPTISENSDEVVLARTEFRFSDGATAQGFCSPSDSSGLDYLQPVVFSPSGHVPLWRPGVGATAVSQIARDLAKPVAQVFPIVWRCAVAVDGEVRGGEITEADVTAG